jgi:hypothetical protein
MTDDHVKRRPRVYSNDGGQVAVTDWNSEESPTREMSMRVDPTGWADAADCQLGRWFGEVLVGSGGALRMWVMK